MKIFFVGLPGSGKTTLGRALARCLNYEFLDTDDEIIRSEGKSIEAIFQVQGENYFREQEHLTLLRIISKENAVVSTGGGLPCFFNNMDLINENGLSIFINVPTVSIANRLKQGKNKNRPMVTGKSDAALLDFLETKYKERIPFYSRAKHEIRDESLGPMELVAELRYKKLL